MVTPRDRVCTALKFKEPDICPYYIWIDSQMLEPISRHYGVPDVKESVICDHSVMTEILAQQHENPDGTYADEFGTVWRQGNIPHIERPALTQPTLAGYTFPDLTTPEHYSSLPAWFERYDDRFRIVQLGMLFFERAWCLRGFENLLMDFHESPRFVEPLLDGLEEGCCKVIDHLLANFGEKIDAIGFSDDYGGQETMLLSPTMWRRFLKPHLARMYERIHRGGKKVYLHTCGHVTPIIPDLIEIGVDMLQPIQPETMNIFELKRRFGRDLCLVGGISTQRTLPYGTPDDVRREVRGCLENMARGGGYIIAPAKPILPGVPLENAVALIDAITGR